MALCPYCKKDVNETNIEVESISKKAFKFKQEMFSCPYCHVILGFASAG